VQRDLLPIVEGTTVQTRYGSVSTEKIMFIAAGAFHRARPSDLMPELQGRFPIRVELQDLTREDFIRILTEPSGSITRQYAELLAVDGIHLEFTEDGIQELADVAFYVNQTTQNIGARRLQTIMERLLEELSFDAPDCGQQTVTVDRAYVKMRLDDIRRDEDLSRFVL
jgi:ATP-dependent HslUV protease ATP-binding subunit HslU